MHTLLRTSFQSSDVLQGNRPIPVGNRIEQLPKALLKFPQHRVAPLSLLFTYSLHSFLPSINPLPPSQGCCEGYE